jgi:NTE family protein
MPDINHPVVPIHEPESSSSPVRVTPVDEGSEQLKDKIALCLSGGGYRAMMFHLGALTRLNEFGYLGLLDRISSVSGGSITAGVLALHWNELGVTPGKAVAAPKFSIVNNELRKLAGQTIDVGSILEGVFGPGTVSEKIQTAYDNVLFHGATLQSLPDSPRFVINATNVQSGVLFRFSKPYLRDWRVGEVKNPRIPLAAAVAASSAFPPVLSPAELDFQKYGCTFEPKSGFDLQKDPFTSKAVLSDGGVYDNLALETVWKSYKTVLISDGGGHIEPEESPHRDWARHAYRILEIEDNQVRSLRKRQVMEAFDKKNGPDGRDGTYWGIRTDIAEYNVPSLPCPAAETMKLARISTRLKALSEAEQECLMNWGYAVCDAAMRRYVDKSLPVAGAFLFPRGCTLP